MNENKEHVTCEANKSNKDTNTSPKTRKFARSLYIGRVKQSEREVFEQLVNDGNFDTHKQLFAAMLSSYQALRYEFSDTERAIIEEARTLAPKNFDRSIKRAALRYAKNIIEQKNKPSRPIDTTLKNSAKSADARADILITEIFEHNELADNWYDKILLTKSSIFDYAKKQKDLNQENIAMGKVVLDRCLERNKELIERHHEKQGMQSDHNIKAHYERLKMTKEEGKNKTKEDSRKVGENKKVNR
jgi:hypothetical protein